MTDETRFDRNERLFGHDGQGLIAKARLAIVGLGGLGSHVAQQAAYLGIRKFVLIDGDVVTMSSLNRLIGARLSDAVAGTPKVTVAERVISGIEPAAEVTTIEEWLDASQADAAIRAADVVIGCLDDDVARLALTAVTSESQLPYFDLASEVEDGARHYGGRVLFALTPLRCAYCLGELDPEELALAGLTREQRTARDRSYGVSASALRGRGAAVVSLNGVVASLAVTELMVYLTGLRPPAILLRYRGDTGTVTRAATEPTGPCPFCGRN